MALYKGMAGSPITNLVTDVTSTQTSVTVANGGALPDAPNICTICGDGAQIETILYTSKSGDILSGITRGIEGTAKAWPAGTEVARYFTAYDQNAINSALDGLRTDITGGFTKRVDLTGQVQVKDYRRSVIALCEVTNTNPNSYSIGTISFHRGNGLLGSNRAIVAFEKSYNNTLCNYNVVYIGHENVPRACTFVYNGAKYGGLEVYIGPAFSNVAFNGESNFDIFGVDYYNTDADEATIPEIADSINFDEPIPTGNMYFNGMQIATRP
jgi:hypothetical protein